VNASENVDPGIAPHAPRRTGKISKSINGHYCAF
jgi:hypothetical protein